MHRFTCIPAVLLALALSQLCDCARAGEPEIVGSERFSNQVRQALLLLKARDANAYVIVAICIGRIVQGERSGTWAYRTPPTYEMSDASSFRSMTWAAAHDRALFLPPEAHRDYRKVHRGPAPAATWAGTAA